LVAVDVVVDVDLSVTMDIIGGPIEWKASLAVK
jgi:hypothetical protein